MSTKANGGGRGFAFTAENMERTKAIIARYPEGRQQSAVMPLLDLAQRQGDGWLPREAIDAVADMLAMPRIRAYEVASFYTMFNTAPVGRHLVQLCRTTPCWLRGSDDILAACKETLGIGLGETTGDGLFTLVEVECLGACCNAPMMQINDDYYEDLDADSTRKILETLRRGETPGAGSQTGRRSSEPATGLTTLKETQAGRDR
jgi:NADH-quinone oxidoreductase subunit E